jgi:lipoprotein-releasing system permease protein
METPFVDQVIPMVQGQALASADGNVAGAYVRGVPKEELQRLRIVADNVLDGSLEAFGVDADGFASVAVGSELARKLNVIASSPLALISPQGAATPFGSAPRRKTYDVGAIFSVGMAEYDSVFLYMPIEEAQLFFNRDGGVDQLEVRLSDPDRAEDVVRTLRSALPPHLYVSDWKDQNASLVGALVVERNVVRLILMMIVAIAAMNIISGLVMLVKNKSRDIAILRTMGASQGSILRIFFMAGAAVGVLGTVAGLVLGVLFCTFIGPIQDFVSLVIGRPVFPGDVYSLNQLPAKIEWGEVGLVAGWALMMSFLATLPPAFRASRLDPVEALRYE